ncbi:MAG: hypothetical protein WC755_08910 [Candidatus Woesearchaeota archaeon]|jgi:hypothetical protein
MWLYLLAFLVGIVEDIIITMYYRSVSADKATLAMSLSFTIAMVQWSLTLAMVSWLGFTGTESFTAAFANSLGLAIGTGIGMKIKIK